MLPGLAGERSYTEKAGAPLRFYLISDNVDTQVGMRLAGIDGVVVHEREEVEKALRSAMAMEDVAVVLITETLLQLCPELIYDLKLNQKRPLIVEIPDRHGNGRTKDSITRYVREAMVYLEQNCGSGDLSVGQAAAQLGLSEGHLSHLFKKETDMTLGAYLTRCRIQKAMALLREGKLKVYEVAEACGYRDIAYFSGTFKKITGKTPSEYQDSLSFRF